MKLLRFIPLVLIILMMGCSNISNMNIQAIETHLYSTTSDAEMTSASSAQEMTNTPIYNPTINTIPHTFTPLGSYMSTRTNTPVPTNTPTSTETLIPTNTPIPTEIPTFAWNPSGDVIAPILLYHHVSDDGSSNRYYVSLDNFRAQMEALHDWGYTTITDSDLAHVLINGGVLPNRPIVITFDDGYGDVYQNAFPIMNEMGFLGVMYIYVDHIGSNEFVTAEQIQDLAKNGWGIGNHSMSHADLTLNHSSIYYEVQQSRLTLEEETGIKAETFAYPYGKVDDFVVKVVRDYGYLAGMGLGLNYEHTSYTLFNLSRIEVQNEFDLSTFAGLLPWSNH